MCLVTDRMCWFFFRAMLNQLFCTVTNMWLKKLTESLFSEDSDSLMHMYHSVSVHGDRLNWETWNQNTIIVRMTKTYKEHPDLSFSIRVCYDTKIFCKVTIWALAWLTLANVINEGIILLDWISPMTLCSVLFLRTSKSANFEIIQIYKICNNESANVCVDCICYI